MLRIRNTTFLYICTSIYFNVKMDIPCLFDIEKKSANKTQRNRKESAKEKEWEK